MENSMEEICKLEYLNASGRVVTEQHALGQLADNCIYVLPTDEGLTQQVQTIAETLSLLLGKIRFVNEYDFEVLKEMPAFDNHTILGEAVMEHKSNMIMPLNTPYLSEKLYLIVKVNKGYLKRILMMMIYESERITRLDMNKVLLNYAQQSPRAFCDFFERNLGSDQFEWIRIPEEVHVPDDFYEALNVCCCPLYDFSENNVTYQKKTEIMERLFDNIKKYKKNKDPRAEAELAYVLNSMDVNSFLRFLSTLPKKQVEEFCRTASPQVLAEESKLRLDVKKLGKEDLKFRTNGFYRLFLCNEKEQQQVHFKYKESLIVYLIYLIDKLEKDSVDSISIKDHKGQFLALYNKVYSDDDANARFDDLFSRYKDGKPHQAQIKHCYSDIRFSVGNVCEKMHELSTPFVLKNAKDHLSVLKDRITIHNDLLEVVRDVENGKSRNNKNVKYEHDS